MMHKYELYGIGSFLLLLFSSLLIFGQPSLSGYAVKQPTGGNQLYGMYSYAPSISISFEGFAEYQLISQQLPLLLACAQTGIPIENCAKQNSNTQLLWSLDCEKGTEKIFYEIAQFIDRCAQSQDTNCVCTHSFERTAQQIKDQYLEKRHEFSFSKDSAGHSITSPLKSGDLRYSLAAYPQSSSAPNSLVLAYSQSGYSQGIVEFTDGNANKRPFINQKSLALYKSPTTIEFAREEGAQLRKVSDDSLISTQRECSLPPKEYQRFCVTDNTKKFLVYDGVEGTVAARPITIRFAAKVQSTPPPPIKGLSAIDAPKSAKSIILTWDESQAHDVESYSVYWAASQSDLLNPLASVASPSVKSESYQINAIQPLESTQSFSDCIYDLSKKQCLFNGGKTALVANQLYRMGGQAQQSTLVLLLPLDSDSPYSFAVAAKDTDGLIIDNSKPSEMLPIVSAQSKNDIAQSSRLLVSIPFLTSSYLDASNMVSLSLRSNVVQDLIDGTPSQITGYVAYHSPSKIDENAKLSSLQGPIAVIEQSGTLSFQLPQGAASFVIVAKNQNANVNLDMYSPKELGADIINP